MPNINHKACITDHEVILRCLEDDAEIEAMKREGYHIKAVATIHAKETFECHRLPIFSEDTLEDILNRYADFFPRQCKLFVENIKDYNQALNTSTGMSDGGSLLIFAKLPRGLQAMLDIWCGGDFLSREDARTNMRKVWKYWSKFKIGRSYGKKHFAV